MQIQTNATMSSLVSYQRYSTARSVSKDIEKLVKGVMIESYIEPGNQKIGEGVYGKSITDPCLGWDETERLIYEIADRI